jgi:RNA polymerase-binding transcription factor DksA
MNANDLKSFHQQLLGLATRLRYDVADLRADAVGATRDDAEMADSPARIDDIARRDADWEVTMGQLANEEQIRAEVDDALERVTAGTFGLCLECGKAISSARLRAVPYARFCIACAQRHEVAMVP